MKVGNADERRLHPVLGCLVALAAVLPGTTAVRADEPDRVPVERLAETLNDTVLREGTHLGPAGPATELAVQVCLRGDAAGLADYARRPSTPAA
ncbi:hypothetical protein SAMN05216553_103411 [Lentzea fradiae]|uniref:Uncharacterized protein n=1 Tax=Lentzea fradiae TaxID=200378 RepID=A0A1G7P564_9PSEU|nr:hypothetical protein [Lentzea fradiae]SDF81462.1 hypothetical protein SAMN05216553_103411 [Lentzea fradiae]